MKWGKKLNVCIEEKNPSLVGFKFDQSIQLFVKIFKFKTYKDTS